MSEATPFCMGARGRIRTSGTALRGCQKPAAPWLWGDPEAEGSWPAVESAWSSPKSGAWKGSVAGGGDAVAEQRGAPSGAEKSEVRSMRRLPLRYRPSWDLAFLQWTRRSYNLVILAYGLRIRSCVEPKSTSAAIPSSTPITRPRPYMSCVTWSPTAKCWGVGVTRALKGLVGK